MARASFPTRLRAAVIGYLKRRTPRLAAFLIALRRRVSTANGRALPAGAASLDTATVSFVIASGVELARARKPRDVVDVRPAQTYRRERPVFANSERLDAPHRQWYEAELAAAVAVPAASVALVGPAVMFGHGYVTTRENLLLSESIANTSSINPASNYGLVKGEGVAQWMQGPIRPARVIRGPAATLRNLGETVWGHWLIELLPRIELYRRHPLFPRTKFVVLHNRFRAAIEALVACGVDPANIVEVNDNTPIRFEHFLCATPLLMNQRWIAPQNIAFLQDVGRRTMRANGIDANKMGRRLFITRDDARHRRLLNQTAVGELLRSAGFETVTVGDIGFARQVEMFAQAEAVAVVLGSGASNLVFSRPGTPVMYLAPNRDYPMFFLDVASMMGHRLALVFGESVKPEKTAYSDFSVDLDDVRAGLAALGLPPTSGAAR